MLRSANIAKSYLCPLQILTPVLGLLLFAIPGQGQVSSVKRDKVKFEPTVLKDNKGKRIEGEIGRLRVPENRTKAKSRLIEIAFIRFKSPRKDPRPPIFFLAGGPGGSGIDMAKGTLRFNSELVFDFFGGDIIGIDQRGTGMSRPNLRTFVRYGLPLDEPGDPDKLLPLMMKKCRALAADWRRKGVDLTGYNTAENADDINAVRAALSYKKINIWGGSYGSHLAFAVIRRHDKHLNRVVAQSPEGPNHTYKLPSQIQTGLERVSKLVAKDPRLGERIPDLVGLVERVLDRLEKEPITVKVKHPFTGANVKVGISKFDVQMMISNAIGRVRTMRPVPKTVYAMSKGDFTLPGRQLAAFSDSRWATFGDEHDDGLCLRCNSRTIATDSPRSQGTPSWRRCELPLPRNLQSLG